MKTIHRASTSSRTARLHRVVPVVGPTTSAPVAGRRGAPSSKRRQRVSAQGQGKTSGEKGVGAQDSVADSELETGADMEGVMEKELTTRAGSVGHEGSGPELEAEMVSESDTESDSGRSTVRPAFVEGAASPAPFTTAGRDAFELYLNEIGQTPLLTPQEEEMLARRVQKGDEDARERMIKANLRLVVKIAREYEGFGVPLLDLISEGNMGLIKGVERFDPDKGAKLSTYAAWWIKQNIRRALANQSKTVRLPAHVVEKRVQIRQVETKLTDLLGRTPNDAEIAEELGLEAGWIRHYRQALVSPSSLDAPLSNDEDSSRLADIVSDPSATTPYDDARSHADSELIHEVLDTLNDREQQILKLRFGFDGGDESTLEDIGEAFGLTRERIRQIQERALQKLRVRIAERDTQPVAP